MFILCFALKSKNHSLHYINMRNIISFSFEEYFLEEYSAYNLLRNNATKLSLFA